MAAIPLDALVPGGAGMTAPGRIPCINPSCRRTAPAERFPDSTEIICGRCFRTLPERLRRRQKTWWRRHRRVERRLAHRRDDAQAARLRRLFERAGAQLWQEIRDALAPPAGGPPQGLVAFLELMRLDGSSTDGVGSASEHHRTAEDSR